jgi:hypothetical protein
MCVPHARWLLKLAIAQPAAPCRLIIATNPFKINPHPLCSHVIHVIHRAPWQVLLLEQQSPGISYHWLNNIQHHLLHSAEIS